MASKQPPPSEDCGSDHQQEEAESCAVARGYVSQNESVPMHPALQVFEDSMQKYLHTESDELDAVDRTAGTVASRPQEQLQEQSPHPPQYQASATLPGAVAVGGTGNSIDFSTTFSVESFLSDYSQPFDDGRPRGSLGGTSKAISAELVMPELDESITAAIPERSTTTEEGDVVMSVQPVAVPAQQHDQVTKGWMLYYLPCASFVALGVAVLIVAYFVGVGLVPDSDTSNDNKEAMPMATATLYDQAATTVLPPFREDLHPSSLKLLDNPLGPTARANRWMWEDPQLKNYSEDRQFQRFALATLYYSTNGESWINNQHWLDYDVPECSWWMNTTSASRDDEDSFPLCDNETGMVHNLLLSGNNLTGAFPPEMHYLDLRIVDLSHNQVGGAPPLLVSKAANLSVVRLNNNQLQGFISTAAGYASPHMRVVDVSHNQLQGDGFSIGFGRLVPNIEYVDFSSNFFAGKLRVPDGFGKDDNKKLRTLRLASNQLTGEIPTQLGVLESLSFLDLSQNQLTGSIPVEFEELSNLTSLNVDQNPHMWGSVPEWLCVRHRTEELTLQVDCSVIDCCD